MLDPEVEREVANLFPGHPPKPVGHINQPGDPYAITPSDLDPCQNMVWEEKWDENRCILFNGLCFNRTGSLYTKLDRKHTYEVAKGLEKLFKKHEYFVFDVGFIAHGNLKGTCFLFDIPQHKGTYEERRGLMDGLEESMSTYSFGVHGKGEQTIVMPEQSTDGDALYHRCRLYESDPVLGLREGVVGKPKDHIYQFSLTENKAKEQGWVKVRYK